MKKTAFAIALAMSSTAFAQTASNVEMSASDSDMVAATPYDAAAYSGTMGSHIVQPGNASPERDARGVAVISAPAMVPAGWNGTASSEMAMGGPLLDPETGAELSGEASYPACTAARTDACVQAYERGRR
ncbi:MAG TPA: hypothetical protein VGB62_01910 [Allosphingosinicella sp.]|jgi:hypothetical protein